MQETAISGWVGWRRGMSTTHAFCVGCQINFARCPNCDYGDHDDTATAWALCAEPYCPAHHNHNHRRNLHKYSAGHKNIALCPARNLQCVTGNTLLWKFQTLKSVGRWLESSKQQVHLFILNEINSCGFIFTPAAVRLYMYVYPALKTHA